MIGKKLHPILLELEKTIAEFNCTGKKPEYPKDSIRSASMIFISVLMDKMYDMQESDNMEMKVREEMATKCGEDIRKLIHTYTGLYSHDFFK